MEAYLKSNALVATDLRSGADFLNSLSVDYNVLSHKYHSTQIIPEGDTEQRTDKRRKTNEIKDFCSIFEALLITNIRTDLACCFADTCTLSHEFNTFPLIMRQVKL